MDPIQSGLPQCIVVISLLRVAFASPSDALIVSGLFVTAVISTCTLGLSGPVRLSLCGPPHVGPLHVLSGPGQRMGSSTLLAC